MLDICWQYAVNMLAIYLLQVIYILFMDHYSTSVPKLRIRVSGKRTSRRNGESGNMGAVSDDGSSGIEDGLRELHNSTGERRKTRLR